MKYTFAEKKMDSSEDLRAYATRKIGKLDKLFRDEGEAFVTFSIERGRYRAEITIKNNGMYYRANELTLLQEPPSLPAFLPRPDAAVSWVSLGRWLPR